MHRLAAIFLACVTLGAATNYVDVGTTGTSSNSGTVGNPWTNLASVVWASINAADVLLINQGNYNEPLNFQKPGVIIRPYPGATSQSVFTWGQAYASTGARIDGLLGGTNRMFKFTAESPLRHYVMSRGVSTNIYWGGFEVSGSTNGDIAQAHGFFSGDGVSGIVVADAYVHDTSGDAYSINNMLDNSTIGYTNSAVLARCVAIRTHDDGVEFSGGGNALVIDCHFDNQGVAPMFGAHPDGVQASLGYGNYKIASSYFSGFNQYIFFEFSGKNMRVENCVFYSGKHSGTDRALNLSGNTTNALGSTGWAIINNTGLDFLTYAFVNGGVPSDCVVAGNLMLNCARASIDGAMTNAFNAHPNLWWDEPGVQFYSDTGTPIGTPSPRHQGTMLHGDPILDASYVPQVGGAADGTGENWTSLGITTDFYRSARPALGTWTIGAVVSATSILPPPIIAYRKVRFSGAVNLRTQ